MTINVLKNKVFVNPQMEYEIVCDRCGKKEIVVFKKIYDYDEVSKSGNWVSDLRRKSKQEIIEESKEFSLESCGYSKVLFDADHQFCNECYDDYLRWFNEKKDI